MAHTKAIELGIREILKKEVKLKVPIEKVDIKESLKNLGLDSVAFVILLVAIENKFSFTFDDDSLDFISEPTIENLVITVCNNLEKKE